MGAVNLIVLFVQIIYRPFEADFEGNKLENFSLFGLVLLSLFTSQQGNDIPVYEQVIVTMITMICVVFMGVVVFRKLYIGFRANLQRRNKSATLSDIGSGTPSLGHRQLGRSGSNPSVLPVEMTTFAPSSPSSAAATMVEDAPIADPSFRDPPGLTREATEGEEEMFVE